MKGKRKIKRRRFICSLTGLCALLFCKPSSIFEGADPARVDPIALLAVLQRQVRRDFELGRTIEVDGWILSVTEARLCALVEKTNSVCISRRLSDSRC